MVKKIHQSKGQSKSKIGTKPYIPKQSEIKKIEENPNSIPLSDFFDAYFDCRKHKRSTPNARHFEVNYEDKLIELWYEVNTRTYEIGYSICFLVTRPKLREVFAADFRDRIVHHIIMMRLEPLFENIFIDDTYNCRKGKGTLYGIQRLHEKVNTCSEHYTKQCYIGKFDLQGFFMSIHKPTLWKLLEEFINEFYHGNDKELLKWLCKMVILHHPEKMCKRKTPAHKWKALAKNKSLFTCGKDRGLAIGNLTSQCFANFYMHVFDNYMTGMFKFYGRYVDDFYVVAEDKQQILDAVPKIKHFLKDMLKLKLHPDKTYIQSYDKGVKFTGSVIKGERMYIGNQTVAGMTDKIRMFNYNICEANAIHFVQTLNSYFGFMKHYESYGIKFNMALYIDPQWLDYISIVNMSKAELKNHIKPNLIIGKDMRENGEFEKYFPIYNSPTDLIYIDPEEADRLNIKPDMSKIYGTVKEHFKMVIVDTDED